jgi:hypothetical protein
MRKFLVLVLMIILANLAFTPNGGERKSLDCPAANCAFLPLIGNPPPAIVFEIYQTTTRAGTFRFTGDVIAFKPVCDVVVEVRSLADDFTVSRPVVLKASLPGQLNPFEIVTNMDSYYQPHIEARVLDWKPDCEGIYRNVTIVSTSYDPGYLGILVTAELRNDEARPLLDVKGVIWGLDQLYAIVSVDLADRLAPGETIKFSKILTGAYNLNTVHVSAQGVLQP